MDPMKWEVLMKHQKCICISQRVYPIPPNILHLLSIRVKCACVWGKITPMKRGVLMKHPKSLPKTSKYFTPDLVFGLNVQVSGVKMGCFHKVLPNVKSVYVTHLKFYPRPQKILHRYICHICDIMKLWVNMMLMIFGRLFFYQYCC